MNDTILEIECLDELDNPKTLYFSKFGFIDESATPNPILYKRAIDKSVDISIAPDDGGVLNIFNTASVGDVTLVNIDGAFDYLKNYSFDGRPALISTVVNDVKFPILSGTVGVLEFALDTVTIPLRAVEETLSDNIDLLTYAGTNVLPVGLEGTEDTIKGNVKPELYGDCRNITPRLVNQSLNIYEVSTLSNCRIRAVYDTGAVLDNYKTAAAFSIGVSTVSVHRGLGNLPVGAQFYFSNHFTLYEITSALSGGNISFTPTLVQAVGKDTSITVTNFYADETTANLQYVNYVVDGDVDKGAETIPVTAGTGMINAGDNVMFSNHLKIYEVLTGLTSGNIVLTVGVNEDLLDGTVVQLVGANNPVLWGAYNGYFRLSGPPSGEITVDAVSVNGSDEVHKTGDIMELICNKIGVSLDASFKTDLNNSGYIGLYIGDTTPKIVIIRQIVKSVAAYFYFIADTMYGKLIDLPSVTEDFTIHDSLILDNKLSLIATGLGSNRLPIYSINVNFDKIETVQTSFAGITTTERMERLKNQYRKFTLTNASTLVRHLLSLTLDVDVLARNRQGVNTNFTRFFNLVKVQREVFDVTISTDEILTYELGQTVKLITPRYGLNSGKNFILIGITIDDNANEKTFRLMG